MTEAVRFRHTIAKAIFEEGHPGQEWDRARIHDQWLAVHSWDQAGAVMRALGFPVARDLQHFNKIEHEATQNA